MISLNCLDGATLTLSDSEFELFKKTFNGKILTSEEDGYEDARRIWNGMIDRHPGIIARCNNSGDVIEAVKFARTYNLLTSVRGGGHNVAGNAVCESGFMIDLSPMNQIKIEVESKKALVEPGCSLGDVDRATQAFGLVLPSGIVTSTGVAGLTLGGGFGWLSRKWGLTCDHLISAEVITADGELVKASAVENSDLFWGLKGGGGNFGIVTSFEFSLRELGPEVTGGLIFYKIEEAEKVISFYNEFLSSAPREITTVVVYRFCPPAPFVPEQFHFKPVIGIGALFPGKVEKGMEMLMPLKKFGSPVGDIIFPKPFVTHQAMLDSGQPKGSCYYWKSEFIKSLSSDLSSKLVGQTLNISSPVSIIAAFQLGGAIKDIKEDDTAYSFRNAEFALNINTQWPQGTESEKHLSWARETQKVAQPYSLGSGYINFASEDETQERVIATYGNEKYKKLVSLKRKYDPDNFFRMNQNIKPE